MKEQKFYICKHCKNLISKINDGGAPLVCCGEEMTLLVPNTTEASTEKHIPVVTVDGNKVKVVIGSVAHPMIEAHFIQWIYLKTEKGGQRKSLVAGEAPEAVFVVENDKPIAVYAYCNLHGLWETEL
ncbi:MAG: desulfoferrodoxin family protein [Oscillospiraceae bacterium]